MTVSWRSTLSACSITLLALSLVACGSKGSGAENGGAASGDVLQLGSAISLTGSLAREGQLTQEGYQLCEQQVNAKGGVPVGDRKLALKISYQDDTSKPNVAAQIADSYN